MMRDDFIINIEDFINFDGLLNAELFPRNPFQILGGALKEWMDKLLTSLEVSSQPVIRGDVAAQAHISGRVYIAEGARVEPFVSISGPAYIGPGSEVRNGAYIRGNVYLGLKCVVGHATEVKGSCFFDLAKAGHFAYVGDSLLGRDVNLGAGTKLANLNLKKNMVKYFHPQTNEKVDSGLKKFGSVIGDRVQTGCNSVLSPGSLLYPGTSVKPCAHFRGTLKN